MAVAARTPSTPSRGPDCPTHCRSAASPPHERFVDVTPMSLRRDRPLQRLVGRHIPRDSIEIRGADRRRCDQVSSTWESTSVGTGHAFHCRGQSTSRVHFRGNPNGEDAHTKEARTSWLPAREMTSRANTTANQEPRLPAQRPAVKRRAAVRGRPSASTACWAASTPAVVIDFETVFTQPRLGNVLEGRTPERKPGVLQA